MATDDDSDVPESGGVFTFGKSKFADNVPSKFWVRNDPVADVACGDEHTALVAESGRIFTFGTNDWGQLGLGDSKVRTKPSCIKSLKTEKIQTVACGRSATYVATESGRIFTCGGNSEGQLGQGVNDASIPKPAPVEGLPNVKVKMLSAGADHAALLTEEGKVYMWGGGSEGQLGLGEDEECPTPKLLDMDGEAVTCISCGYYHTALTTEGGDLYTFGETEGGKLGLGENPLDTNIPQKVSGIPGRVRMVACGGSHTVAVTTDGRVYSFGDGSNGQLGHGNIQLQADMPQEIVALRDTKIHSASCGENHTALISYKGVLFTFGDGRHGKLALGEENFANQFKPSAVTRFGGFTVEKVACGGCHMLVLARPKVQNGMISASDEDEEVEEEPKPMKQLELLRRSDDLDLSGSFSARNRRREKQDPSVSMSRTLPPLNSSLASRSLPPLSASVGGSLENNPLNKSMLPPLKKPGENSSEDKKDESTESEENKVTKEDSNEDSDDSEPKRSAVKPVTQSEVKASPVPRPRLGVKVKPSVTNSEEESDSEDKKKVEKKTEKRTRRRWRPPFRKQHSDSEEDDEEESKRKNEKDKKEEKKKDKSRAKKQKGGLFGKKKILDSDEEEESEEDNDSEMSSDKDKEKGTKKKKDSDDEEADDKKKKNTNKKVKSKSDEEEESSEDKEKDKDKDKDSDKETKQPPEKKKSKLCTIL